MKTVIEMALESGVAFDSEEYPEIWQTYMDVGRKELERFAELVASLARADAIADEREACAKVCEATPKIRAYGNNRALQDECAAAIRARGEASLRSNT